jgi:hypothetical protein
LFKTRFIAYCLTIFRSIDVVFSFDTSLFFPEKMGYGPSANNRFGWAWRNEYGGGTRMTPYFKTEELANAFHEYWEENIERYTSKSAYVTNPQMKWFRMLMRNVMPADLRQYKLMDVCGAAADFVREKALPAGSVVVPRGETLKEFYGTEMKDHCAYYEKGEREDDVSENEESEQPETKGKKRPKSIWEDCGS